MEFGNFKKGEHVIFTNIDRLNSNEKKPFDFGVIESIDENFNKYYIKVISDNKYKDHVYFVDEDNVALVQPGDTLDNFEYIDDNDINIVD